MPKLIEITYKKRFNDNEAHFWKQNTISAETILKYNVHAVECATVETDNKKTFTLSSTTNNPVFAYQITDSCVKFYQPHNGQFKFSWAGKKPEEYVFGYDQLPERGKELIITGGEKDALVLSEHGYNAICFNSESAIPSEILMYELKRRFECVKVLYDLDETGERFSKKLCDIFGLIKVTLPSVVKEFGKDVSDYFKASLNPELSVRVGFERFEKLLLNSNISNHFKTNNSTNPFPVEVFPKRTQELIVESYNTLSYPIEFTSTGVLFATSVAIGNNYKLEVKRGHRQPAILYLAIVGKPGTIKSHALNVAIAPLKDKEKEYKQEYDLEMSDALEEVKHSIRRKEIIVSDTTPEALNQVLEDNPKGVGYYRDELISWVKDLNKYRSGSDEEYWLSLWNNDITKVNRKSSKPITIMNPFVSVCGTIQPDVLKSMSSTANGFNDRILFSYSLKLEEKRWVDEELSEELIESYKSLIIGLNDQEIESPRILKYDQASKKIFIQWFEEKGNYYLHRSDTERGIQSKMESYIHRLALILQVMYWQDSGTHGSMISVEAIQGAIKLVEYFRVNALLSREQINGEQEDLDLIKKFIEQGYSKVRIGRAFGVSDVSIGKRLKK